MRGRVGHDGSRRSTSTIDIVRPVPGVGGIGRLQPPRGPQAAHRGQRTPGLVVVAGQHRPPGGQHQRGAPPLGRRLPVRFDDLGHRLRRVPDAGDQAVRVVPGERGRLRAARGHQHGQWAHRRRVQLGRFGGVVPALEGQLLPREEQVDDLQRLLHPLLALLVTGKLPAQRPLVDRLAGAHAEHEPAAGQPVRGRRHLRDQRRVVVEQRARHGGAKLDPLGPGRDRAEPRPDEAGCGRVVDPGVEVVRAEHHIEADCFGCHGLVHQDLRLVLLVAAQPGKFHLIPESRRRLHLSRTLPKRCGAPGTAHCEALPAQRLRADGPGERPV